MLFFLASGLSAGTQQTIWLLQAVGGAGEDDDAKVELVALELLTDGHRGLFVHEDVEMGIAALEA